MNLEGWHALFIPMAKILIIEDDLEICRTIEDWLTGQLHTVETAHTGGDGLDRAGFYDFDLIILDLNLPDMDGINILKELRAKGLKIPILILSGRKEIEDKELGLDVGADDYLIKPFHVKELSARLRALLRRLPQSGENVLHAGAVSLDPKNCKVTSNGQEVTLAPREFALLEFLMRHPRQLFSADALLNRVWPSDSETAPDAIRVYMTKLRNKIDVEGRPSIIRTVKGVGYELDPGS